MRNPHSRFLLHGGDLHASRWCPFYGQIDGSGMLMGPYDQLSYVGWRSVVSRLNWMPFSCEGCTYKHVNIFGEPYAYLWLTRVSLERTIKVFGDLCSIIEIKIGSECLIAQKKGGKITEWPIYIYTKLHIRDFCHLPSEPGLYFTVDAFARPKLHRIRYMGGIPHSIFMFARHENTESLRGKKKVTMSSDSCRYLQQDCISVE
jgi:hypothetical protein